MNLYDVTKSNNQLILPDGQTIKIEELKKINRRRHNQDCFLVKDNSLNYIYFFNGTTSYKLYEPHLDFAPTLWINGSLMHTVSVSNPSEDAKNKVKELGHIEGNLLDTCFGLGYTANELAKRGAKKVQTYEISKEVIDIANINPWSASTLENKKIKINNEDVIKGITKLKDNSFDKILHDPPNVKISGDLYSLKFYMELYRVIKNGGMLYHFIGGGRIPREYKVDYVRGSMERLKEAGFSRVKRSYRGLIAYK